MDKEISYTQYVGAEHVKAFGQYFTPNKVASFMCAWAGQNAKSMLDPAAGNSIFLTHVKEMNPQCALTGYEADSVILDYFGNPSSAALIHEDYLLNGWNEKYDAIICNPPYNRFQAVENRDHIIDVIYKHTGVKYSGYTNLYILFLVKSIFQMSDKGRLAYLIPSEFMNSKYGVPIKQMLIEQKLLRAIINFKNDDQLFFNATTTCCILLLDREPKKGVSFYNLETAEELSSGIFNDPQMQAVTIPYEQLTADEKWRTFLNQEIYTEYRNLKPVSAFCTVTRGIATGANDYFCFSTGKARDYGIPDSCLSKCICRSADVKTPIFTEHDFEALARSGKTVYLLDVTAGDRGAIEAYIRSGEKQEIDKKYLLSHRKPWYSMEQKASAPIWVSSACRNGMKFVRNLAQVKALTTFHSVFVKDEYSVYTDLLFCYFLTPIAQTIIRQNRKALGNGLDKFQPNDLNHAQMLDVRLISVADKNRIEAIYQNMAVSWSEKLVEELNAIFEPYLTV